MSLYRIHFNGDADYVEANCITLAVTAWQAHVKEVGVESIIVDEPDSIELVHEAPVIRG